MEILAADGRTAHEIFAEFPTAVATPELKVATTESAKFEVMKRLRRDANFGAGVVNDIDGIRVDYADGWGLVRPSNTSPVLSLRFEADDQAALQRIQSTFDTALRRIDKRLALPSPR